MLGAISNKGVSKATNVLARQHVLFALLTEPSIVKFVCIEFV